MIWSISDVRLPTRYPTDLYVAAPTKGVLSVKNSLKSMIAFSLLSFSAAAYALPANTHFNEQQLERLEHQYFILGANGYCFQGVGVGTTFCELYA